MNNVYYTMYTLQVSRQFYNILCAKLQRRVIKSLCKMCSCHESYTSELNVQQQHGDELAWSDERGSLVM